MHRDNKLSIYKRDSFKNENVEVSTNHTAPSDTVEEVFAKIASCSLLVISSSLRRLWILFSTQVSLQESLSRLQSSAELQAGEHSVDRLQVIHIDILQISWLKL